MKQDEAEWANWVFMGMAIQIVAVILWIICGQWSIFIAGGIGWLIYHYCIKKNEK